MAGELNFKIFVDDSDLNDVVRRVERSMDQLSKNVEKAGGSLNALSFTEIAEDSEGLKSQLQAVYSILNKVGDSGSESQKKITGALALVIKNYSTFEGILRAIIVKYQHQAAAVAKDTAQKTTNAIATTAQATATRGATAAQIGLPS